MNVDQMMVWTRAKSFPSFKLFSEINVSNYADKEIYCFFAH